jgi:hypothetical protein
MTVMLTLLAGFVVIPAHAVEPCPPSQSMWVGRGESDITPSSTPPGELMIFDALVLRPLGIVSMAIGLGGAFVTAPWAATSHSGDQAANALLEKPAHYTFCRPIGEVDYE